MSERLEKINKKSENNSSSGNPSGTKFHFWCYGLAAISLLGVLKSSAKVTEASILVSDDFRTKDPKVQEIYSYNSEFENIEKYIVITSSPCTIQEIFQAKSPIIEAGIDYAFDENNRVISSIPNNYLLNFPFICFSTVGSFVHILKMYGGNKKNFSWINMVTLLLIVGTFNLTACSMIKLRNLFTSNIGEFIEYMKYNTEVMTVEQMEERTDIWEKESLLMDSTHLTKIEKFKLKIANIF
mmetsp:Transcript_9648/g.8495  ORF Transcript_9648/g.8495 Transcript_9648/m.8495 type:complete len:240 (+) Transcript_9648:87-806(+)